MNVYLYMHVYSLRHVATGRWVHFAMAMGTNDNNESGGKEYVYICLYI